MHKISKTMGSAPKVATILLLALLSAPAVAALGGNEASIAADQAQMKATRRIRSAAQFTVHELQSPSNTVVREYVNAQGTVFAVAWHGPQMPDLREILGSYFSDYTAAAKIGRAGRGAVQVRQPGLVVQSGGHMRAFSGRAYLPQLLPAGMAIDEIR